MWGVGVDFSAVVVEGEAAAKEDEDDDAEGPGVDRFGISLTLEHFGCFCDIGAEGRKDVGAVNFRNESGAL